MTEQNTPQDDTETAQGATSDPTDPGSTPDETAPETGQDAAEGTERAEPRAQVNEAAAEAGYFGTLAQPDAEDPNTIRPASEAAPEGLSEDRHDAVVGDLADHRLNVEKAVPLTDTKPLTVKGESYRQGYVGTLPGEGDRPDLTLGGVTARDYPDASEGDTGQPAKD